MTDLLQEEPSLLLRILIEEEEQEEDLRQRDRFPEREGEVVCNRIRPPGYKRP
jgi:hypothetical protein